MMTSSPEPETNLPDFPTRILIGTTVTLDLIDETGEPERLVLTLVPDEESDFSEGRLGESTPLAQSLFGKSAGCSIDYGVGGIDKVLVRQIEKTQYVPNDDVAAGRKAIVDKAVSKSNLNDAVQFSLTVDLKWGDTDPQDLESGWEPD